MWSLASKFGCFKSISFGKLRWQENGILPWRFVSSLVAVMDFPANLDQYGSTTWVEMVEMFHCYEHDFPRQFPHIPGRFQRLWEIQGYTPLLFRDKPSWSPKKSGHLFLGQGWHWNVWKENNHSRLQLSKVSTPLLWGHTVFVCCTFTGIRNPPSQKWVEKMVVQDVSWKWLGLVKHNELFLQIFCFTNTVYDVWYWIIMNHQHVGKRLSIVQQRFPILLRYQRVDPYVFSGQPKKSTTNNSPDTHRISFFKKNGDPFKVQNEGGFFYMDFFWFHRSCENVTWRRVEWRLENCKDDVRWVSQGLGLHGWYEPIVCIWANYNDVSRRVVTLNGGLIRELPQNPLNSGLGIILICQDVWYI